MPGRRLMFVGVSALAAVLLAAGCGGGDDESSAEAWANDVCTSVTTWTDQLVTSVESLGGGNLSSDAVSAAVDDVSEATDTLESDLSDLGAPDTESGADAEEAVSTLATQLADGVQGIQTAFEGASTASEVLAAATVATETVGTMWQQVTTTFTTIEGLDPAGELQSAFEDSSECTEIKQQLEDLA